MQTWIYWIVFGLMCVATALTVIGCFKNRKIRVNLRDALSEANLLCETSLQVPVNEVYYVIKVGALFLMDEHYPNSRLGFTKKAGLAQKYTNPVLALNIANSFDGMVIKYGPIDEVRFNFKS